MKSPQLSKPEATAARNQNSIGDRMEKKTLQETRLSWGGVAIFCCHISATKHQQALFSLSPHLSFIFFFSA